MNNLHTIIATVYHRQMLTFQMLFGGTNFKIHLIGNQELRAQLQVFCCTFLVLKQKQISYVYCS